MGFENTHADELVEQTGELLNDESTSGWEHVIFLGLLQALLEYDIVGGKGILVHARD